MLLHVLEQRLAQQPTVETSGVKNSSLGAARRAKNDEFYTRRTDIENELQHYHSHFQGKVVLCNCDDPEWSAFWKFFVLFFEPLGLKKVISTHYAKGKPSYKLEYTGKAGGVAKTPLEGDGDFRSNECVAILQEADIVVTNPPFSLFREYVAQLVEHGKKFLIIGNSNAITYKEIFPLIKANRMWLGNPFANGNAYFSVPDGQAVNYAAGVYNPETGLVKFRNVVWFTNMDHKKRNEELPLFRTYLGNESAYPKYDNYDAIEVSKARDIPVDFEGSMGVPITFLDKYNPAQFEIVGVTQSWDNIAIKKYPRQIQVSADGKESLVTKLNDGAAIKTAIAPVGETYYKVGDELFVKTYARIIIKRKPSALKEATP